MAYNNNQNYGLQRRSPGNQIVAAQNGDVSKEKLSSMYLGQGAVDLFKQALGDEKAARRVLTTVLTAVQNNPKLQECSKQSVLNAALDGEVSKNLSLSNGEYYIIPYKGVASMQLAVNGIKKMCMRSKAYADVDCFDVREGEFKGYDRRTRRPIVEWIEDADAREELPIIGYYAFYELNADYNGFFKSLYWTHSQVLRHADRYSKAFSLETWNRLMAGEIDGWEAEKLRRGSSWYGEPDDMAHMKMCKKTVLKQLLNDGFAPKEIEAVLRQDDAVERTDEPIIRPEDIVTTFPPQNPDISREADFLPADEETVADEKVPAPEVEEAAAESVAEAEAPPVETAPEKKRGRPRKEQAPQFSMFDEG